MGNSMDMVDIPSGDVKIASEHGRLELSSLWNMLSFQFAILVYQRVTSSMYLPYIAIFSPNVNLEFVGVFCGH